MVLDSPAAQARLVAPVLLAGLARVNQVSDQRVLRDKQVQDRVAPDDQAALVAVVVVEAEWVELTTLHQSLAITKSTTSHVVVTFM